MAVSRACYCCENFARVCRYFSFLVRYCKKHWLLVIIEVLACEVVTGDNGYSVAETSSLPAKAAANSLSSGQWTLHCQMHHLTSVFPLLKLNTFECPSGSYCQSPLVYSVQRAEVLVEDTLHFKTDLSLEVWAAAAVARQRFLCKIQAIHTTFSCGRSK